MTGGLYRAKCSDGQRSEGGLASCYALHSVWRGRFVMGLGDPGPWREAFVPLSCPRIPALLFTVGRGANCELVMQWAKDP